MSFANRPDETTALAHLVLPDTHWLESWGDYAPREGVVGLMQPTMMPIRDARPFGDVLLTIGRAALGITEEGKGPLPWTDVRAVPEGRVGADREGGSGPRRSSRAASGATRRPRR